MDLSNDTATSEVLDDAVERFAAEVGAFDPVTVTGLGTRSGHSPSTPGVRSVTAPAGIGWIQPAEMTVRCGAATPVDALDAALAERGQCVALPAGGTVGGALAVGRSGLKQLGWGPVRDILLQARYVSASGEVVKAGGPTVKNVSGFDVCRLLVGSLGTLGFLGDVILRTRPRAEHEQWYSTDRDPWAVLGDLYRPTAVLWDGATTWTLLEGDQDDADEQAASAGLTPVTGPPELPAAHRWSLPARELVRLRDEEPGTFVAEIGVGIVHHTHPGPVEAADEAVLALTRRIKNEFDPTGRLNPGVSVIRTP